MDDGERQASAEVAADIRSIIIIVIFNFSEILQSGIRDLFRVQHPT
jgi:hypothetical protein